MLNSNCGSSGTVYLLPHPLTVCEGSKIRQGSILYHFIIGYQHIAPGFAPMRAQVIAGIDARFPCGHRFRLNYGIIELITRLSLHHRCGRSGKRCTSTVRSTGPHQWRATYFGADFFPALLGVLMASTLQTRWSLCRELEYYA
jgi:hypothetical protein